MKMFDALACLLIACLVGLLFMTWGLDNHGSEGPIYPAGIYILIVVYSAPFWLCTFVPSYLIMGSRSLFWRWYIAPIPGALIGFISGLVVFAPTKYEFYDFPRQCFAPLVIGFATFLFGAVLKRLSSPNSSS